MLLGALAGGEHTSTQAAPRRHAPGTPREGRTQGRAQPSSMARSTQATRAKEPSQARRWSDDFGNTARKLSGEDADKNVRPRHRFQYLLGRKTPLSVSLSPTLLVSLSPCLPASQSPCLPVFLCPCRPVFLFPCLPVSLSLCVPVSLSPCRPVFLSPCLPVSLDAIH